MSTEQQISLAEFRDKIDILLENSKASDIHENDGDIVATIYGFKTRISLFQNSNVKYFREGGGIGSFSLDDVDIARSILFPTFIYTKNNSNDDAVLIRASDVSVNLYFLCAGDFFIARTTSFVQNASYQMSEDMFYVEQD